MRVAIYARYSSDRQNEASARDQIDRCRRHAAAKGWDVRETYSDEARRGTDADRPGLAALHRAVDAGRVDVVLVESLDRLSRTTSEAMSMIERFTFARVGVVGIADGVDTSQRGGTLVAGIRATLAAEYLTDLSDKTRRGMLGRARAGLSTGCLPYGYRSRPVAGGGAAIEIDPERAATVRRIFADHAAGYPVRAIAAALNSERVEPPRARPDRRGTGWMHTSVRAILGNEKYAGRWVFGRRRWVKEPGTGQRKVRAGIAPEVSERPELAIVDRDTWDRVAARFTRLAVPRRRVSHLLSGLLHCAACGTVMTINGGAPGRRYYTCARARARGGCDVREAIREVLVRELVVERVGEMLDRYAGHIARRAAEKLAALQDTSERDAVATRLRKCEERAARLVAAVADGAAPGALVAALRDLEAEAARHRDTLAAIDRAAAAELPTVDAVVARARDVAQRIEAGDPQTARERLRDLLDGGRIEAERVPGGWSLRGGLVVGALLDRQPPAEDLLQGGRLLDFGGCGGAVRPTSDGLVVPFRWCLAA